MSPINIAIVGVGKIVRDQHLPALAKNADYRLIAAASRHGTVDGIDNFKSIEAMIDAVPAVEAVSLCMPPQYRYEAARTALAAGKHVFLEKPPGATLSEVADLEALAEEKGVSLFASWHSRYAPAVEAAKAFLASAAIRNVRIIWKEDVRHWHPNQEWIWAAGGSASSTGHQCTLDHDPHPAPAGLHHLRDAGISREPGRADRCHDRLKRCRKARCRCRVRLAPDGQAELGHRR